MNEKNREIVQILKEETNLFQLFGEEDLEKIAPYFERLKLEEGDVVFEEGDPADFIAFVKSGRVEAKKSTEFHGKQIVLAHMSQGSILGELALFDGQPRSASTVAIEKTELLVLKRESLEAFFDDYPVLGIKVLKGISRVLSLRLRQLTERLMVVF